MAVVLWIVGVALVAIGIAGIVFPALPGHVLIFAGLLAAAWADDFSRVGPWTPVGGAADVCRVSLD